MLLLSDTFLFLSRILVLGTLGHTQLPLHGGKFYFFSAYKGIQNPVMVQQLFFQLAGSLNILRSQNKKKL